MVPDDIVLFETKFLSNGVLAPTDIKKTMYQGFYTLSITNSSSGLITNFGKLHVTNSGGENHQRAVEECRVS